MMFWTWKIHKIIKEKSLFESVVAVAFQTAFHAEMYQNDIYFFIFKNYFWDQRIKTIQNIKKINF
jgi:hypothetical protein